MAAFDLAVAQGADMIETDLHRTRDGAIVLHHDFTIDQQWIGAMALDELRERRPAVPTLEDALDAFGRRIAFNLELKSEPRRRYPGLEARVLEVVRRRRLMARTLFSSFDARVVSGLRRAGPDARLGLLVTTPIGIERRARRIGAEAVHLPRRAVTRRRVRALRDAGWRVHVFTVDRADDLSRLMAWGVDGIFTNVPARLRALVDANTRTR
jgi:glycerophosphoryl diester phosphodiesterase